MGNLDTVRVAHPELALGRQMLVPKKDPFVSKLCLIGWSWEAWGWVREGFGQVLAKVLHVLAKGLPTFYLEWVSYE